MALFESYERRNRSNQAELKKHGISSIEEAKKSVMTPVLMHTTSQRAFSQSALKTLVGLTQ